MSNMFTSVFSFLTIIPSGSHTLEDTAKNMHAFPAIGLLMGFVLGIAALGLYYLGVDQIIVAFLLVAATKLVESFLHNLIMCFSVLNQKVAISPEMYQNFSTHTLQHISKIFRISAPCRMYCLYACIR